MSESSSEPSVTTFTPVPEPAAGPGPAPRLPTNRLALAWTALVGLIVLMVVVIGHAARLIAKRGPELHDNLDDAITERYPVPGQRGFIYSRDGVPLAVSEIVQSCFIDPKALLERRARGRWSNDILRELSAALDMPVQDILDKAEARSNRRFIWLKRKITDDERSAIEMIRHRYGARDVGLRKESLRSYPQGTLAAHIVGFINMDGPQEGVEKSWDGWLREEDGWVHARIDSAGRPIELVDGETRPPHNGRNLVLTIDSAIQRKAEQVLMESCAQFGCPSGSAIVMDVRTGEVLALANFPTYDPNFPGDFAADARKNRAITDPYEPGSTFKVFVAAAALGAGVTRIGDPINCHNGLMVYAGRRLHDHHSYGLLPFEMVVAKSSNPGMAELGLRLGNHRLYDAISAFGFGRSTGIGLPGESRGLLYPPTRWSGTSILSLSMGQELAVTPLQLVRGFSGICNGGRLLRPTVVRTVTDPGGEIELDLGDMPIIGEAVGPRAAGLMVDPVLSLVVTEGTGAKARLKEYRIFGKTGTAQISKRGGGYEDHHFVGSFIAGAPVREPRIAIMVNLNYVDKRRGGYYGGTVAAPAVKSILEFALPHLGVPPDPPTETAAAGR